MSVEDVESGSEVESVVDGQVVKPFETTKTDEKDEPKGDSSKADDVKKEGGIDEKDESKDESSDDDKKDLEPWKGKKSEVSNGLKKRFNTLTTSIKELKAENDALKKATEKPEPKEMKREDFPDDAAFNKYQADKVVKDGIAEYDKARNETEQAQAEAIELQNTFKENLLSAGDELKDFDEVFSHGDPDLKIDPELHRKILKSPVGPHVMYRLASDEEFSEKVKAATPEQQFAIISDVHDKILDFKIKAHKALEAEKESGDNKGSDDKKEEKEKVDTPAAKKKTPPKAPPKVPKGVHQSRAGQGDLSGDEYARQKLGL